MRIRGGGIVPSSGGRRGGECITGDGITIGGGGGGLEGKLETVSSDLMEVLTEVP